MSLPFVCRALKRMRAGVAAAVVSSTLVACYSQHPLTAPVPVLGTQIVAELTDSGTVVMGNQLGPGVTEVEGYVAEVDGSSWKLLMTRVEQRGVGSTMWNREPVTFPRSALTHVTERRLDKKRSWLAAGVIATAAIVVARTFGAFSFGGESGGDAGVAK